MRTKAKRTLADLDRQLRVILLERGYKNETEACREVGLDRSTYDRAKRRGIARNPRVGTIEKLRGLGVLDKIEAFHRKT